MRVDTTGTEDLDEAEETDPFTSIIGKPTDSPEREKQQQSAGLSFFSRLTQAEAPEPEYNNENDSPSRKKKKKKKQERVNDEFNDETREELEQRIDAY